MARSLFNIMLAIGLCGLLWNCTTPSIVATRSIQLGDAMNNANKYEEAIGHYEQYLAASAQLGLYRNQSMEAEVCRKLAHAYATQGNYNKANDYLAKAINIDVSVSATNLALIEDYRMKGMVDAYTGDYKSAIESFDKALALSDGLEKSLKDSKRQTIANIYLSLAQVHLSLGNYKNSEEFAVKSLKLFTESTGDAAGIIEGKLVLGIIHRERNNLKEAIAYCQESRQLAFENKFNTSRQEQALGEIYFLKGDFEEGIRYKLRALEEAERSNIKPQIIVANMRMGDAYRQLGDERKANSYYRYAMQLQNQLENNGDQATKQSLNLRSGDLRKAYAYYTESSSSIGAGLVCLRLGALRFQQNDLDSAGNMFRQAMNYFEQAGHSEGIAKSCIELSKVLTVEKKFKEASEMLGKAKALTLQPDLNWQIFFRKGILFESTHQYDSAYAQYLKSIETINAMRGNLTLEEFKTAFANTKVEVYDRMIMLLLIHADKIGNLNEKKAVELAFLYNEESRSRTFLDMLGNRRIEAKSKADEILLEQEQLLRLKIQRLVREIQKDMEAGKNKLALQAELRLTQDEYDHLLHQIRLNNPAYSSLVGIDPVPIQKIQSTLDDKTAIMEYWISGDHAVVWLLTKKEIEARLVPVKMNELKRQVAMARSTIYYQYDEQRDSTLQQLYTWLIDPLVPNLKGYSNLIIMPHRNLHFLPFHTLMNRQRRFLIEEFVIQYAPSAGVFYYCVNRPVSAQNSLLGLALGDLALGEYAALPGTEVEINHVSRLYDESDIQTDENFSETYLKENIDNHGYVHLATHGAFNVHQPLYSYLLMAPTDHDDGRLTVEEIFGLNVKGKIVTLSACETGLGDISEGDDLVGLSRAFIYAGAPAVIVSLWKVDDATTAWLMVRFYQYVRGGYTLAESLTFAQRDLIQRNFTASGVRGIREIQYDASIQQVFTEQSRGLSRNPYFWAPFVLIGNGGVR